VVDAAMRLFAAHPAEPVTVAEIAEAAGMTSAAVYYHYASKDDILLEGLQAFSTALLEEVERLAREPGARLATVPAGVLRWLDHHVDPGTVWFVTSTGLNLVVEARRAEVRAELLEVLTRVARAEAPSLGAAGSAVIATGLLSLIEVSAASWLTDDESVRGLGRRRFLEETEVVAERLAGLRDLAG